MRGILFHDTDVGLRPSPGPSGGIMMSYEAAVGLMGLCQVGVKDCEMGWGMVESEGGRVFIQWVKGLLSVQLLNGAFNYLHWTNFTKWLI